MSRSAPNFTHHPRTRFNAFLEGTLSPTAHQRVHSHVQHCRECQHELAQRNTVWELNQTARPARTENVHPTDNAVVMTPEGTPGWKVLVGAGAVGLVSAAVVMSAWVLGAREQSTQAAQENMIHVDLPAEVFLESSSTSSDDLTGTDHSKSPPTSASNTVLPATSIPTPTMGQSQEQNTVPANQTATVELHGQQLAVSALSQVRSQGWNVPRLSDVGYRQRTATLIQGTNWAEISTQLQGSSGTEEYVTTVRECRRLDDDESGIVPCTDRTGVPVPAQEIELPTSASMRLFQYVDGSWTAELISDQAAYQVDSTAPIDQASAVMTSVILSEQSRIQPASLPDTGMERLQRGFQKLLPWVE